MLVSDIQNLIAAYLNRTAVTDLIPSNLTPAGINVNLGLFAINNARRFAERAHDFKYCETNVFLSIGSTGGGLTSAYQSASVAVTGTLNPNVVGTWTLAGIFNGLAFYTIIVSTVEYFLYNDGAGNWVMTTDLNGGGGNKWSLATTATNPAGTYTHAGTFTGSPVVAATTATVGVKRIKYVSLPLSDGEYQPIEFLTSDEYTSRQRIQIGRQTFNATKTLQGLGGSYLGNPLAYQNGQTVYLAGNGLTLPITAQLSVVQWMPDYTAGTNSDFFTQYGGDFLFWRGLVEINKLFRRFVPRTEGNIDEAACEAMADQALQTFIAWDSDINRNTSTPDTRGASEATPQSAQQAA